MSFVRFTGLRPVPPRASDVAAPPYDVLSTEEARRRATGKPWSFLHISKPEIDLPPDTDPHAPEAYAQAARSLRRMLAEGVLVRDPVPFCYAYRLVMNGHVQTGAVVAASVAAYDANRIRRHEHTRPDKEDDRVRQIEALNAQTGPVLLAYPDAPEIDAILAEATRTSRTRTWRPTTGCATPTGPSGRRAPSPPCTSLTGITAPPRRRASPRRGAPRTCGRRAWRTTSTSSPSPFRTGRCASSTTTAWCDLGGLSLEAFLARLGEAFTMSPADAPVRPSRHGEFWLYAGIVTAPSGCWHQTHRCARR